MPSKYVKRIRKTVKDRFCEKFYESETGCWVWTGAQNTVGYGHFRINGKTEKAHRVAYQLFVSDIAELDNVDYRGTCVMHKCDNPLCVNPDHLVLGTHADNMTDKKNKCRVVTNPTRGETNYNALLSANDVIDLRMLRSYGVSLSLLAKEYGVSKGCISSLARNKTWKHI